MSRHGHILKPNKNNILQCPESNYLYEEDNLGRLHCLNLDEDAPLPLELSKGKSQYRNFK